MQDTFDPNGPEAIRIRAMALAVSGRYQSWTQIAAEMEREGFSGVIAIIRGEEGLDRRLNQACDAARVKPN